MNVDFEKPRYIECIYEAPITFDLEELGIDWDNVKDYYIKYGTLYVDFKDGTSGQYEGDQNRS
jgi:coenzyme F420-reducing hydrogenase beta subunit